MIAAERFGDAVVAMFEKTPPRCLRGRWGSVDDVDASVISVLEFAYEVFLAVFGTDGAGGRRAAKRKAPAMTRPLLMQRIKRTIG